MLPYEQITPRIETFAKSSAIATLAVLPISTSATIVLFYLTTLLLLLSGHWQQKMALIKCNPIALCFLGFYTLYLIGITYSIGSATDIKHELLRFSWLLFAPLWLVLFTDERWRTRGVNTFLIVMTITLILSFVKQAQWTSQPNFWLLLNRRLSTTTTTAFKDYLAQSFLMSLAATIFFQRFIDRKHWLYGILFLAATINILFINQGRSGYIVFSVLMAYLLFSELPFKKAFIVCGISAVFLGALVTIFPGTIHKRSQLALQDIEQWHKGQEQTSLGYRIAWQENALTLFKERPIIGYGTGSIKAAYATLPKNKTAQTGIVDNTSNEYLNIAVQFGSIGLLLFLTVLFIQWRYSFFLPKEYRLIAQTVLIAVFVGNFANSWLMDFTQGHYYGLMTTLAFGAFAAHREPSKATDHACSDDVATDTPA